MIGPMVVDVWQKFPSGDNFILYFIEKLKLFQQI
jgi:hypothetical protein